MGNFYNFANVSVHIICAVFRRNLSFCSPIVRFSNHKVLTIALTIEQWNKHMCICKQSLKKNSNCNKIFRFYVVTFFVSKFYSLFIIFIFFLLLRSTKMFFFFFCLCYTLCGLFFGTFSPTLRL